MLQHVYRLLPQTVSNSHMRCRYFSCAAMNERELAAILAKVSGVAQAAERGIDERHEPASSTVHIHFKSQRQRLPASMLIAASRRPPRRPRHPPSWQPPSLSSFSCAASAPRCPHYCCCRCCYRQSRCPPCSGGGERLIITGPRLWAVAVLQLQLSPPTSVINNVAHPSSSFLLFFLCFLVCEAAVAGHLRLWHAKQQPISVHQTFFSFLSFFALSFLLFSFLAFSLASFLALLA